MGYDVYSRGGSGVLILLRDGNIGFPNTSILLQNLRAIGRNSLILVIQSGVGSSCKPQRQRAVSGKLARGMAISSSQFRQYIEDLTGQSVYDAVWRR